MSSIVLLKLLTIFRNSDGREAIRWSSAPIEVRSDDASQQVIDVMEQFQPGYRMALQAAAEAASPALSASENARAAILRRYDRLRQTIDEVPYIVMGDKHEQKGNMRFMITLMLNHNTQGLWNRFTLSTPLVELTDAQEAWQWYGEQAYHQRASTSLVEYQESDRKRAPIVLDVQFYRRVSETGLFGGIPSEPLMFIDSEELDPFLTDLAECARSPVFSCCAVLIAKGVRGLMDELAAYQQQRLETRHRIRQMMQSGSDDQTTVA
jgi:hypothetical protein